MHFLAGGLGGRRLREARCDRCTSVRGVSRRSRASAARQACERFDTPLWAFAFCRPGVRCQMFNLAGPANFRKYWQALDWCSEKTMLCGIRHVAFSFFLVVLRYFGTVFTFA